MGATEICIHPAALWFGLYAVWAGHGGVWVIATLSILLHEAAHAAVSALFSVPPTQIEWTPLGAVMRLEDEQRLSKGKRLPVILAGPAMTAMLCSGAMMLTKQGLLSQGIGRTLFISNLGILMMNLLPVLPLDGGRLICLAAECFLPVSTVRKMMRLLGSGIGMTLILLNLLLTWKYGGWNLSLAFAGCCMMYSAAVASTTQAMAELRVFLDRRILLEKRQTVPVETQFVLTTMPLRRLLKRLPARKLALYRVLQPGTMKMVGSITEFDAVQCYLNQPAALCGDLIQ